MTYGRDIWVYDWQRDTMTRLTFGAPISRYPIWSPDGRYIVYSGRRHGLDSLRRAGKPQSLTQSKNQQIPWSF